MARGAASHFSMRGTDYESYYPLALGVLQNFDLLVSDAERLEDRSYVRADPRSGQGPGVEMEIRRRPKGVDVHVLVAPEADLPMESGRFLMREGAFGYLQRDPASARLLADLLPSLRRDQVAQRQTDPHFSRAPIHLPDWMLFDLKGGGVMWILGGLLGTAGGAYLVLWAPNGAYRSNDALMAGILLLLVPWFSGIWGRAPSRGAASGFVSVFLPTLPYAISATGLALPGLAREPGISAIDGLLDVFPGTSGLLVPPVLGLLAVVPGAIAGLVGGRLFPIRMQRATASP